MDHLLTEYTHLEYTLLGYTLLKKCLQESKGKVMLGTILSKEFKVKNIITERRFAVPRA